MIRRSFLVLLMSLFFFKKSAKAGEPIFKATGIYAEKAEPVKARTDPPYVVPEKPWPPESTSYEEYDDNNGSQNKDRPDPKAKSEAKAKKTAASSTTAFRQSLRSYSPWFVNGHHTDDRHLIRDHGVDPSLLLGLSQDEKNRLHGMVHTKGRVVTSQTTTTRTTTQYCPNGVCPTGARNARRR